MRAVLAFALVGLTMLAGCTASFGSSDPAATDTITPMPPPETTAEPPVAASPDNTVDASELTDYQREAFRAALEGDGAQFIPNSGYIDESEGYRRDHMDPFVENEFVRSDGAYYRIDFEDGELFATYGIHASPGTPGENDTVVALSDLPSSVREEARRAVTEGEYSAPYGKWDSLPEPLRDADYISYETETYRMGYVVGDDWARVMTVEKVS